jgi:N,N'-diacetyllegionaminate synthase
MHTTIIAEAGVNHNGSLKRALQMIDVAGKAGADVVKFQTWKTEKVVTRTAPKAAYQVRATDAVESQFEMLKRLELTFGDFARLQARCDKVGIRFLSTADEIESAVFLDSLQTMFKVGSAELTDIPFLRRLARFGKPVLLSTGMGNLEEVRQAVETLVAGGLRREQLIILHCSTSYPTPYHEVNLRAMLTIRDALKVRVGYSDHTRGIQVPIAAVALGAEVIEKHFTLDKTLPGPDHRASLNPRELEAMVKAIRRIETALGDGLKRPSPSERANMVVVRKSVVASRPISKGDTYTEANLTAKRPGTGLPPSCLDQLIGRKANRDYARDEMIQL